MQVEELAGSFPEFVYKKLLELGYITLETPVTFVDKKKSRRIEKKSEDDIEDVKVSHHFILEIGGVPVRDHRFVCNQILHQYRSDIAEIRKTKALDHLSDAQLDHGPWGMDPINHGNQPFATLLSRKCGKDPLPVLVSRIAFQQGKLVGKKDFERWPEDDANIQTKLWLLYQVFLYMFSMCFNPVY